MSIQKSLSSALGAVSAVVAASKALESMEAKNEAERVKANSPDKKPKAKEPKEERPKTAQVQKSNTTPQSERYNSDKQREANERAYNQAEAKLAQKSVIITNVNRWGRLY